jgi:hypothetical protein
MTKTLISMLMLSPVILLCSCATTGYQRAAQARSAINDARVVTADVQQRLDAAVQAMQNVTSNDVTNLVPPYEIFAVAVEGLRVEVEKLAHSDQVVQKRNNAYIARWQDLLKGYRYASVRTHSAERRAEVIERFRQLKSEFQAAEGSLRLLLVSLEDLRRYLGTDLTNSGVASAQEQTRISAQLTEVQRTLQALLADLVRVEDELSPTRSTTPEGQPAESK